MITIIILVIICYYKSYYSIIDYIPHAGHFILVTYFITGNVYLLIFLTHVTPPLTFLPSVIHLFIYYIYESVSVFNKYLFSLYHMARLVWARGIV